MDSSKRETIAGLKGLLQTKFGSRQAISPATAMDSFENELNNLDTLKLKSGIVYELLSGSLSSGTALVIEKLLSTHSLSEKNYAALIDGRDSFDPESIEAGNSQRLLWVRCRRVHEAMKAADLLLRDGNLSKVILDLQLNPVKEIRQMASSTWYRLRALAEETDTTLVVFSAKKTVPCAAVRIQLRQQFSLSAFDEKRADLVVKMNVERALSQRVHGLAKAS